MLTWVKRPVTPTVKVWAKEQLLLPPPAQRDRDIAVVPTPPKLV